MESKALEELKENFGTIEDYQTLVREINRLRDQNEKLKVSLKYAAKYKKLMFICIKYLSYIKNLVVYKTVSGQAKGILDLYYQLKKEEHEERNLKPSNSGELKKTVWNFDCWGKPGVIETIKIEA